MRYLLARRTRAAVGELGAVAHTDLGTASTPSRARGKIVQQLLVEAQFLEAEHAELGTQWRLDRARRLRHAATNVVPRWPDTHYASVDVDGVRYGWVREEDRDDG